MADLPDEPWLSFLSDLENRIEKPVDLHCIGGFVVSQHYGFSRETGDLDILAFAPGEAAQAVLSIAGRGSLLHRKFGIHVDYASVANFPDQYEQRLIRMFPALPRLRLWALEAHDLALTKLERSIDRDIRDVMYLAQAGLIDKETLLLRFETELEPYLAGRTASWHRTTLAMWIKACWPA